MTFIEKSFAPKSSRLPKQLVGGLALAALLGISASASARPEFPGVVQDTLGLDCAPPCQICHTSAVPDGNNPEQLFALNVIAWSMTLSPPRVTEDTLPQILKLEQNNPCIRMEDLGCQAAGGVCTSQCDANGNGKSDIDDLLAETDPNPGAKVLACPKYGCGAARVAPKPARPLDGSALLVALGTVCVLVRRFRR